MFLFLNNWYGFEHGGDGKSSEKVFNLISSDEPKTQKELAVINGFVLAMYLELMKCLIR